MGSTYRASFSKDGDHKEDTIFESLDGEVSIVKVNVFVFVRIFKRNNRS